MTPFLLNICICNLVMNIIREFFNAERAWVLYLGTFMKIVFC